MSNRDAPGGQAKRTARRSSSGFADFVADNTADGCTADGSACATARKNGASDGTGASADGSVPILRRHAGTSTQADQHCGGNGTKREFLYRFHRITSFSNMD